MREKKKFRGGTGRARIDGFCLTDLGVTCLLVMVLAAAGLDLARGLAVRLRMQAACGAFVSSVERARDLAVARNGSYQVRIRRDGRAFAVTPVGLEDDQALWRDLPPGLSFVRAPRRSLTFHSRGSAAPSGSFSLASGTAEMRVVVSVSGRTRWEWSN